MSVAQRCGVAVQVTLLGPGRQRHRRAQGVVQQSGQVPPLLGCQLAVADRRGECAEGSWSETSASGDGSD